MWLALYFVFLYFSYVFFGPYWFGKLVTGQKIDRATDAKEIFRRASFLSYIGLLFVAWFLYKPSLSSFTNALLVTSAATAGYYMKWGHEQWPMHIVLNVFVVYKGLEYVSKETIMTLLMLGGYFGLQGKIYKP